MKTVLLLAKVLSAIFQQTLGGFPYLDKNSLCTNGIIWLIVIIFSSSFTYGSYEGSALEFGIESALCNPNKEELVYLTDSVENKEFKVVKENSLAPNELSGKSAMSLAYCYPNSTGPYGFYIKTVIFEDISNPDVQDDKKTNNSGSQGYISQGVRDYSSQFSTDVQAGSTYTLTGMAKLESANSHRYIWIDFNQNDIFESNEEVVNIVDSNSGSNTNFSHSFQIDANATPGLTRMRIMVSKDAITYPLCSATFEGEMEDYELNITGGGSDTTPPEVTLTTPVNIVEAVFDVTTTFNENVTGLEITDFVVTNGVANSLNGNVLAVIPQGPNGTIVTVSLPANSVLDDAGNGNVASDILSVTYNAPDLNITGIVVDETQPGAFDGEIDVTVTGGSGNYTFAWSNSADYEDLIDLAGGTYSLTVTDPPLSNTYTAIVNTNTPSNNGCSNPTNVALGKTAVKFSNDSDTDGSGAVNGSTASWPPENFVQTDWNSNAFWWVDLGDLYDIIQVRMYPLSEGPDFADFSVYLSNDPFPNGIPTGTPIENFPGETALPFSPIDGNYTGRYLGIRNNSPGILRISEVEVDGCLASTAPEELAVSLVATNPTSPNGNDGSIEAIVTGGTPPYNYIWQGGNSGSTTNLLENLGVDNYSVTIVDAAGQTVNANVDLVFPLNPLSISLTGTNASTDNVADGSITTVVTGGWGPYTFLWNNGMTEQNPAGLLPGIYNVTVTDELGEMSTANTVVGYGNNDISITIESILDATCPGSNTGAIEIAVSGGTPDYQYTWSNGAISQNILNVADGNYSVTVVDANFNSATATVTVDAGTCGSGGGSCAGAIELANNKPSAAKSLEVGPAGKVVDGDLNNYAKTADHTASDPAWWEVNLGSNYQLEYIELTPRSGSVRLSDFSIYVSDQPFPSGPATTGLVVPHPGIVSSTKTINFPSIPQGSWLRIQNNSAGKLEIGEAKIFGCVPPSGGGGLGLEYTVIPPTGVNSSDGAIILNPFGGTPEYTFDWGADGDEMNLSMIDAGTYAVTVTDEDGNTVSESIIVTSENITPVGTYHSLKKKLDGGVAYSSPSNLRFKYHEKYQPEEGTKLSYKIYGNKGVVSENDVDLINALTNNSVHQYGMNYYTLPVYQIPNVSLNNVYTLEVSNGNKGEVYYLRFRAYCPTNDCVVN